MSSAASSPKPISRHAQAVILGSLRGLKPRTVVSSRRLIAKVRAQTGCRLADDELAELIREAALLLGLVPVYVREPQDGEAAAHRAVGRDSRLAS